MDFNVFPSADHLNYQNIILSNGISSYFVGWTDKKFSNSYYDNAKFIPNDFLEEKYTEIAPNTSAYLVVNKTYFPVYKDDDLVFNFDADASKSIDYNSSIYHENISLNSFDGEKLNVTNAGIFSESEMADSDDIQSLFKGNIFNFSPRYGFIISSYHTEIIDGEETEVPDYGELSVLGNQLNYRISDTDEIFSKLSPLNENGYTSIFIGTIYDNNVVNGFKIGSVFKNAKKINNIISYDPLSTHAVTVDSAISGAIQINATFSVKEIFQRTKLNSYKSNGETKSSINIGESIDHDQFIVREAMESNEYNHFYISQSDDNNRLIFNNSNFKINLDDGSIIDKTVFIARSLKTTRLSNGNYQCSLSSYFRSIADEQLSVITDTATVSQEVMNAIIAENDESKNLLIGVSPAAYLTFFNGNVKRLSLFKRALSFDEINGIATDLSDIIDTSKIREVRYYKNNSEFIKSAILSSDTSIKIPQSVRNASIMRDGVECFAEGLATSASGTAVVTDLTQKITGITPGTSIINYYIKYESIRTVNFVKDSSTKVSLKIKSKSTSVTIPSEASSWSKTQDGITLDVLGFDTSSSATTPQYPKSGNISITSGTSDLNFYAIFNSIVTITMSGANRNYSNGTTVVGKIAKGSNYTIPTMTNKLSSLYNVAPLAGWTTNINSTTSSYAKTATLTNVQSNITLYPVYTPYEITSGINLGMSSTARTGGDINLYHANVYNVEGRSDIFGTADHNADFTVNISNYISRFNEKQFDFQTTASMSKCKLCITVNSPLAQGTSFSDRVTAGTAFRINSNGTSWHKNTDFTNNRYENIGIYTNFNPNNDGNEIRSLKINVTGIRIY